MNREIIGYIFIVGVGAFYVNHTLVYSITFSKSSIFRGTLKIFHMIMFWLVPFIWIMILKALSESLKGSYHYEDKGQKPLEPWSDPYKDAG